MDLTKFQRDGKFLMLALDHRGSFKKLIGDLDPVAVKSEIINSLEDQFSGVLIDVDWGLKSYANKDKPYLLPVERTGYQQKDDGRVTELERPIAELKNLGAAGAKLLLYFNPQSATAEIQIEVAKKVLDDAKVNNLPFFLEIVTYDSGEGKVVESVEMFLAQNVRPDVFKLEYPGSSENCLKITELLDETPWIILTRGNSYDIFKSQLQDAIGNGCRGFLAGRAVWQEIGQYKDGTQRKEFLQDIVKKRFAEISEIALKS
jgi:tagatose 1,6-diphosphate aldolase